MELLPEKVLRRICYSLNPKDRLKFQNTCKATRQACTHWRDVVSVEVRDDADAPKHAYLPSCSYIKPDNNWYVLKITLNSGKCYTLKAPRAKSSVRAVRHVLLKMTSALSLRIWNAALSDDFCYIIYKYNKVRYLKLWNCGMYFRKLENYKRMIVAMLAQPHIEELAILDSTEEGAHSSMCTNVMDRDIMSSIKAPLRNVQLSGLNVPWRAFAILMEHIAPTCERLSIGCIHGKEMRREKYVAALERLTIVSDLDLPPFIFHLNDRVPSAMTQNLEYLLNKLPLTSLGIRHYNTATLFKYLEDYLPLKIHMVRIHHNATRLPNFAQLGNHKYEEPPKKISMISRHSYLSSSSCEYVPPSTESVDGHVESQPLTRNSSFIFPSSFENQQRCKRRHRHRAPDEPRTYSRKYSLVSCHCDETFQELSAPCDRPGPSGLGGQGSSTRSSTSSKAPAPKISAPTPSALPKKKDLRKSSVPVSCEQRPMAKQNRCNSTGSTSSSGSSIYSNKNGSVFGGRFQFLMRKSTTQELRAPAADAVPGDRPPLHQRGLTIFAVEERGNRTEMKIRQKTFCGVSVVFTRECTTVQAVLGRMGSPLKSPHVYSKNANREIRCVKGDLVKPIPLTSLGMESDYDASDFEGEPENQKPFQRYEFEFERELRIAQRDMGKFRELSFSRHFEVSIC
uniref:F-box domain-containing protein n=1 Tax=Steinernema glaseri TaxID=37863 RepID=A0A1I7ZG56_9BILA